MVNLLPEKPTASSSARANAGSLDSRSVASRSFALARDDRRSAQQGLTPIPLILVNGSVLKRCSV